MRGVGPQWADIDFADSRIAVRRSIALAGLTTPKSGKSRRVAMPASLGSELIDLVGQRRREALAHRWPDVPEWVFCSQAGTAPDAANVDRVWQRLRRRAQKVGIRPLKLHCARHTSRRSLPRGPSLSRRLPTTSWLARSSDSRPSGAAGGGSERRTMALEDFPTRPSPRPGRYRQIDSPSFAASRTRARASRGHG
jgi:integrase